MKKILILVMMILLVSCGKNNEIPTINEEKEQISINNSEDILINYRQVHEICEKGDYGIVNHDYVDSFNFNTEIFLEDNEIKIVKDDKENYLKTQSKIKTLADVWDCGGTPMVYALDDNGMVYFVDYENQELIELKLDQKVINLAIFNDTSPRTSCGGYTLYLQLEDNKFYILKDIYSDNPYIGEIREKVHPYIDFITVVDDTEQYQEDTKIIYMFFNHDGSASLGYYEDNQNEKLIISDELLKDENGNIYHFAKKIFGPYDNVLEKKMIYLIDVNNNAYGIEITSKTKEYPGLKYLGKASKTVIEDKEYLKITQE